MAGLRIKNLEGNDITLTPERISAFKERLRGVGNGVLPCTRTAPAART